MLILNIPNCLTLLRVLLIPILVVSFYWSLQVRYSVAVGVFILAAVTDWLDGYLARKLKQISPLGTFLDPVADKLIVAVALTLLVQSYATTLFTIPAIIIISREILISALREWMSTINKRQKVAVNYLGKIKTVAQLIAISLLLSQEPTSLNWISLLGWVLMYVATLLTLWSMMSYLLIAWREINEM